MSKRVRIFSLAAFALLLAAGFDILVVDFAAALSCDGAPGSGLSERLMDDCFCCCAHVMVPAVEITVPAQRIQAFEPVSQPAWLSLAPAPLYRPPRA